MEDGTVTVSWQLSKLIAISISCLVNVCVRACVRACVCVHVQMLFTNPLHMVVVGFLQLDVLEDCLVLMSDSQKVHLPPGTV